MKITAIVPAFEPSASHPTAVGSREFNSVDEFAAALGRAAHVDVSVVETSLAGAPSDGYLILFDARDLAAHPEICSRSVLVNADRSNVLKELEHHSLLGAIEKQRYFLWCSKRHDERGDGVFGQRQLADRLGARLLPGPFNSPRYGLLASERFSDLPSLLAGYLAAHEHGGQVS